MHVQRGPGAAGRRVDVEVLHFSAGGEVLANLVVELGAAAGRLVPVIAMAVLAAVVANAVVADVRGVDVLAGQRDPGAMRRKARQREIRLPHLVAANRIAANDIQRPIVAKRLSGAGTGGKPAAGIDRTKPRIDTAGRCADKSPTVKPI